MLNDKQIFIIERVYSHPLARRTPIFLSYMQGSVVSKNISCVTDIFQEDMRKCEPSNNDVLDFQFNLESRSRISNNIDICFNSSMQRNLQKLSEIALLKENWNGYGAKPISHFVLKRAESIIREIIEQPDLFPTADDSIQIEYEKSNGAYLEIQITNKESYEVFLMEEENSDGQTFFIDATIKEINEQVKKFYAAR